MASANRREGRQTSRSTGGRSTGDGEDGETGDDSADWESVKNCFLGAIEAMERMQQPKRLRIDSQHSSSSSSNSLAGSRSQGSAASILRSASKSTSSTSGPSREASGHQNPRGAFRELKAIFGRSNHCKPLKQITAGSNKNAKTWTKDVVCLCFQDDDKVPGTAERMQLARLNIGLRRVDFLLDGDAKHIHEKIMLAFPQLEKCGGYTLLRTADCTKELLEIDDSQLDVVYLEDIVRQAKLYVRPLQCDISCPEEEKEVSKS